MARASWFGRLDPFRQMESLQDEMNRLFDARRWWPEWRVRAEFPPVNVSEAGDDLRVLAELPGMTLEDIDLTITGNTLTIKGERKPEKCDERSAYHRMERSSGSFLRTIRLPERTDPDKAEARYANGVLSVRIPKAEEAKPKKISVKTS